MEIKQQTKLHFNGVDIINVQFQSNTAYNADQEIKLTIDSKVYYPKSEPDSFRIVMTVMMDCPDVFTLNITGVGHYTLDSEADQGMRKAFVNLNAPGDCILNCVRPQGE